MPVLLVKKVLHKQNITLKTVFSIINYKISMSIVLNSKILLKCFFENSFTYSIYHQWHQGLRKVRPYYFTFLSNAKSRWFSRRLTEVFSTEFYDTTHDMCVCLSNIFI